MPAILAMVPLALLVWAVCMFSVDVPIREQWDFAIRIVDPWYGGTLQFSALWQQDLEHRHLFPYLLMLMLATATHWNLNAELAANLVITVLMYCAIAWHWVTSCSTVLARRVYWFLPLLSVLVFSLAQTEIWLFGWHMVTIMSLAAAVWGMVVLAHGAERWTTLVAAVGLGAVASFSFANGFVYWASGLLILAAKPARHTTRSVIVWCLVSALAGTVFFRGYHLPASGEQVAASLAAPVRMLGFALACLGSPVFDLTQTAATIVGMLGCVALVLYSHIAVALRGVPRSTIAALWGMALYAIITAVLVAAGRASFGNPLASRYVTASTLFWIAVLGVLFLVTLSGSVAAGSRSLSPLLRRASVVLLATFSACLVARSVLGIDGFVHAQRQYLPGKVELVAMRYGAPPGPAISVLQPVPDVVTAGVAVMKKHRLSVFR